MENILIVGAHFDDAELGVGGTAAKLSSQGKKVYKLTLTDNDVPETMFNQRTDGESGLEESLNACKVLGIVSLDDKISPARVCELTYTKDMMQLVEKIILDYGIDTVFLHSEHDMNQDHAASGKICHVAARHCKNILVYQSNLYIMPEAFYPTVFFDVSEFIDKKKQSLDCYDPTHQRYANISESENTLFGHILLRNKVWGYSAGVSYAEGFFPLKLTF